MGLWKGAGVRLWCVRVGRPAVPKCLLQVGQRYPCLSLWVLSPSVRLSLRSSYEVSEGRNSESRYRGLLREEGV